MVLMAELWPVLLAVSACGLGLVILGGRARLRRHSSPDVDVLPSDVPAVAGDVSIDDLELPFWVCGHCRIAQPGRAFTDRCEACGSAEAYLAVDTEIERRLAMTLLWQEPGDD